LIAGVATGRKGAGVTHFRVRTVSIGDAATIEIIGDAVAVLVGPGAALRPVFGTRGTIFVFAIRKAVAIVVATIRAELDPQLWNRVPAAAAELATGHSRAL
jgi:hypothetical protein